MGEKDDEDEAVVKTDVEDDEDGKTSVAAESEKEEEVEDDGFEGIRFSVLFGNQELAGTSKQFEIALDGGKPVTAGRYVKSEIQLAPLGISNKHMAFELIPAEEVDDKKDTNGGDEKKEENIRDDEKIDG